MYVKHVHTVHNLQLTNKEQDIILWSAFSQNGQRVT